MADLCTLADVKLLHGIPTANTSLDTVIGALIPRATRAIIERTEREFIPPDGAPPLTRRLQVSAEVDEDGCHVVDFAPYDLASATLVTLHPESASPRVLTTSEYELQPLAAKWGVYSHVRLSARLGSILSTTASRFGHSLADVAGAWGFPAVPADVTEAAAELVRHWLRGSQAVSQEVPTVDEPGFPSARGIPLKTLQLLSPFERYTSIA